ncbi:unnamed protein product [Amoebophrya sp. A25]|nr:unnamed protein product [Amoebophrya sp. A25]|eukprot:GSA25T00026610001.1
MVLSQPAGAMCGVFLLHSGLLTWCWHEDIFHAPTPLETSTAFQFCLLLAIVVFNYSATALSDPGCLPTGDDSSSTAAPLMHHSITSGVHDEFHLQHYPSTQELHQDGSGRGSGNSNAPPNPRNGAPVLNPWCRVCRTYRRLRTKHCRDCGRCVRTFDHHCPWIGNCVGEGNRAFFFAFVFWQLAELCFVGWRALLLLDSAVFRKFSDAYPSDEDHYNNSAAGGDVSSMQIATRAHIHDNAVGVWSSGDQNNSLRRTSLQPEQGMSMLTTSPASSLLVRGHLAHYDRRSRDGNIKSPPAPANGMTYLRALGGYSFDQDNVAFATTPAVDPPAGQHFSLLMLFLVLFVFAVALLMLLGTHIYLISANVTTWEMLKGQRIPYLRAAAESARASQGQTVGANSSRRSAVMRGSPFSTGIVSNWLTFFLPGRTPLWRCSRLYRKFVFLFFRRSGVSSPGRGQTLRRPQDDDIFDENGAIGSDGLASGSSTEDHRQRKILDQSTLGGVTPVTRTSSSPWKGDHYHQLVGGVSTSASSHWSGDSHSVPISPACDLEVKESTPPYAGASSEKSSPSNNILANGTNDVDTSCRSTPAVQLFSDDATFSLDPRSLLEDDQEASATQSRCDLCPGRVLFVVRLTTAASKTRQFW